MMLRRSFFSRFPAAAALFGLQAPAPSEAGHSEFQAAHHAQDAWFDELPGKHRVVFDTYNAAAFQEAVQFTNNYFRVNKDAYKLTEKDFAVVLVARHRTAPFAFNDAMWAKYGKAFSDRMEFKDPKTNEAPTTNVFGTQLAALSKQGLHLAVCNLTTRSVSQRLAELTKTSQDEVYKELTSNTIGPSHFVPAGIVAVTRAQEHGYVLVSIG
jgi:intracellular sulfur oxidation DsrE/DsrF family protein